uniref:Uncharacterized protein n=1 Tax=Lygus hesperus TaxID=30085 RepID=A0A0A9W326_LYGHE
MATFSTTAQHRLQFSVHPLLLVTCGSSAEVSDTLHSPTSDSLSELESDSEPVTASISRYLQSLRTRPRLLLLLLLPLLRTLKRRLRLLQLFQSLLQHCVNLDWSDSRRHAWTRGDGCFGWGCAIHAG